MTDERYNNIMRYYIGSGPAPRGPEPELTKEELEEGWHFCYEWDGLLVGPGMDELEPCHCLPDDHKVYLNRPNSPCC